MEEQINITHWRRQMIIYQNNAKGFRDSVDNNNIVDEIESAYIIKTGHTVSSNEKRSWNNSMNFMETVMRKAVLPDDCGVLIEYMIPSTSKRIDFIITGQDEKTDKNIVIVELKQWDNAEKTDLEYIVRTFVGGSIREVTHPSYQAFSYKQFLKDMNTSIYSSNINPYSCAYLHNYRKKINEPLVDSFYEPILTDTPVFFSQDAEKLQRFIKKYVGRGNGINISHEIEHGKIKPSKKFIKYVSEIFDGNNVFTLLDEQKVAYSNIIKYAEKAKSKTTILINGGPGTGKSVVAMNSLVSLLKAEKNIKFVAPNASFKEAMLFMLSKNSMYNKTRLKALFSGSMGFYNAYLNEFDVLLVDEAHRLKSKGTYMYKGESQVEDIIRASMINVFFIDDNQRVRPNDEGSIEKIKEIADLYDSKIINIELKAQFRCSGAEGFINWLDHNLQIQDTANYDDWDDKNFEFRVFDDPNDLADRIDELNSKGINARMLAGFAWPWTADRNGNKNAEIFDVSIPEYNFKMPWNSHSNQYSWAVDDSKKDQIGCIHTSQGLEFDYVGVIIGNDLRYNTQNHTLEASYSDYYDATGKQGLKNNPDELSRLIKNIYKVLMSRGIKGCYIFCRDDNLKYYFKSRMNRID